MKINFWVVGLIIVFFTIVLSTYNYLDEGSNIIRVGYLPSDHHAALIVAQQESMFEKANLKVHLIPFHSGEDLIEAMSHGKIDMGYCGITPVTRAISKGEDMKIVAPVNLEGSGIVVRKGLNITTANDLKDKRIAIPSNSSMQFFLLQIYLSNHNMSSQDVKYFKSEVTSMPFNLDENSFQAYVAWEPFVSAGEIYNYGEVLSYSENIWKDHPCCVIISDENFIKQNPDKLRRFLEVHHNATDYINKNPTKNSELMSKKIGLSPEIEKEGIKHIDYISIPDSNFVPNVLKIVQMQQKLGLINNSLSSNQLFDFSYLPN